MAGLTTTVPPLRQRRVDVAFFFRAFMERYGGGKVPGGDPRMLECLLLHDWPGNVWELDLLTRRLLALHGHEPLLRRSFLPDGMIDNVPANDEPSAARTGALDRDPHDRLLLAKALRHHQGNVTRAAAEAGISRARAYRLMRNRSSEEFLAEIEAVRANH
jgi:transcriptional regulator with PAS, ATPase and Fis domain